MDMDSEVKVVFMPAYTTPFPQPTCGSRSHCDRCHRYDSSDGAGQSKLKLKGLTILDSTKNIHDSWEDVKISAFTGVWKKLAPTPMDDLEVFQTSVEEVSGRCGGNHR